MTADFAARYGPWALIAGASDGVGAAFAEALAQRGLDVVLLARRQAALDQVAAGIADRTGAQTRTLAIDLTDPEASVAIAAATDDLEIGFLVYCAGADPDFAPFLSQPVGAAEAMVRRNCLVPVQLCHHFAAPMAQRGRGAVVLFGSGAGLAGGPNMVAYGASKAFDMVFAEALWAELSDQGVDVVGLILGKTDTPALDVAALFDHVKKNGTVRGFTGGTPQTFRGVGGDVAGSRNADVPAAAALGFSVAPVAAPGNSVQVPALPAKADTLPLPRPGGATIPDTYPTANFGSITRVEGPGGKYLAVVTKDQVNTAARRTTADIANFLAFPTPIQVNQDGRPIGTRSNGIAPLPPRPVQQNEELSYGGFTLPLGIASLGGTSLTGIPFLIASGMASTLISQELAIALGLDPSILPSGQFTGQTGSVFSAPQASVEIRLFSDPGFTSFIVPVGILAPSLDPFQDNFLGSDILGQLPYWEIETNQDNSAGIFFAAATTVQAVPEPDGLALAGPLLVGVLLLRKKSSRISALNGMARAPASAGTPRPERSTVARGDFQQM